MFINDNLDFDEFTAAFSRTRSVAIPNFLHETAAQWLLNFLDCEMPEDWWWRSTFINSQDHPEVLNLRRFERNIPRVEWLAIQAHKSFASGNFSYTFDRSFMDHYPSCRCALCQLDGFFTGPELRGVLNAVSNATATVPKEIFAARYTSGCFLSPHRDAQKGQVGFVLNLTDHWRPEFGGNLHITSENGLAVTEIIVPRFNTLYLFGIESGIGVPHFVSHVAPEVRCKRLSISGWYE